MNRRDFIKQSTIAAVAVPAVVSAVPMPEDTALNNPVISFDLAIENDGNVMTVWHKGRLMYAYPDGRIGYEP